MLKLLPTAVIQQLLVFFRFMSLTDPAKIILTVFRSCICDGLTVRNILFIDLL